MIQVMFKNNELKVKGHSQLAEKGKDILCASVSTILYMLIAVGCKGDIDEGSARITIDNPEILDGTRVMLDSLSQLYPEELKVG